MIRPPDQTAYPPPDRMNAVIVSVQLVTVIGLILLTRVTSSPWQIGVLALLFAVAMNSVYSSIHEAEHGTLFTRRRVNNFAGATLAMLLPAPFHLIRQTHLGHHLRNRSDDEAFDLYFDGENPLWKRIQYFGTLCGTLWVVLALSNVILLFCPLSLIRKAFKADRPSQAVADSLDARELPIIRCEAAATILFHAGLLAGRVVPVWPYLALYLTFGFTWSALQYVHHFDTERDVVRGAVNLRTCKLLEILWLNHGWHLTHHLHPTVSWIYLPQLSDYQKQPRESMLRAYLRMWRGPHYSAEHVENQYAGRVVRFD